MSVQRIRTQQSRIFAKKTTTQPSNDKSERSHQSETSLQTQNESKNAKILSLKIQDL
ncbi:hypothetical protein SERLA73DRAFT_80498 [Serpula lacrymans var. lacrymans S7.3]|uniref:Uncharacterized protein n=1 Tax=Serpula lacrymans var. lacrymans (strain S7.3) TaxID=936435 RepID=F8QJU7_SERL3|nr:hypothetical protein SERLA73DRAFT_80498 [Serpula lacrymans var. lacrymans S7.3]